jgi:DNA-directed RNA polymerase subunit K/omega
VRADAVVAAHAPAAEAGPAGTCGVGPLDNRFHVVAVACLRVMQIRNGGRLRLDAGGHKPCVAAVIEVVAGVVPYHLS